MKSTNALISLEQALERLLALADRVPVLDLELVSLEDAAGRVLAESVVAGMDLPPWPNSAMDGYALRLADWQGQAMPVSQRILAGAVPSPLNPGTCARIFTGAPLPPGADTVEMQENVELDADGCARLPATLQLGQNVRPQGHEARAGEVLLAPGTRLGPIELGLVASAGYAQVPVRTRLAVGLISTGDELVEPGRPLGLGQIYNSNRTLLNAWLERLGCKVIDGGILPDDPEQTRQRLSELSGVDVILSTGGVSVGEADFLGQVLREHGELDLWKLAIKPGKPLTVGHYAGTPVIGLPGNPASTLVTFGLLARAYLLRRMGAASQALNFIDLPAGFTWAKAGARREFLRARIEQGQIVPHTNQSSGVLRSAAWADGLVEIREGRLIEQGELVPFVAFSELLN